MAQKGLWKLAKEKIMKESVELPNEEGDAVREYKAVHEENFWSSWPREDERGREERMAKAGKNEEKGENGTREVEKEENETGTVTRRCEGCVSVEAFEIFSQEGDLESCGDLSWVDLLEKHGDVSDRESDSCAHVRVVPDVTDVHFPHRPRPRALPWLMLTGMPSARRCTKAWKDKIEKKCMSLTKK